MRTHQKIDRIVSTLLLGIAIIIAIQFVRYGVEFTDSTWYCAEPYLVAKGAVPYVDNWSQAAGFSFPLYMATSIFLMFRHGTEGIVLFYRILYVVWIFLISLLTYGISGKKSQKESSLSVILPMLFFAPNNLYYISYNTIGVIYLALASVAILVNEPEEDIKMKRFRGLLGGGVLARAIIGTPIIIIPCIVLGIVLLVRKDYERLCDCFIGGIIVIIVLVLFCCIRGGGIGNLIYGLNMYLKNGAYFKIPPQISFMGKLFQLFKSLRSLGYCLVCLFVIRFVFCKKTELYESIVKLLLAGFLIYGLHSGNLINNSWFEAPLAYVFLRKKDKKLLIISEIVILYVLSYWGASLTNIYGATGRNYWLFVPMICSYLALYDVIRWSLLMKQIVFYFSMIVVTLFWYRLACSNVYRDEPIKNLDRQIETGIWKGCYTTQDRAEEVIWIEKIIREYTEKEDKVLFLDWSSFGYLMSDGIAFAPSALDNMEYSRKINNPEIMYAYFKMKGSIPDKIIYIFWGRDEFASIEDEEWKFNDFVNNYYSCSQEQEMWNDKILLYVRNE